MDCPNICNLKTSKFLQKILAVFVRSKETFWFALFEMKCDLSIPFAAGERCSIGTDLKLYYWFVLQLTDRLSISEDTKVLQNICFTSSFIWGSIDLQHIESSFLTQMKHAIIVSFNIKHAISVIPHLEKHHSALSSWKCIVSTLKLKHKLDIRQWSSSNSNFQCVRFYSLGLICC